MPLGRRGIGKLTQNPFLQTGIGYFGQSLGIGGVLQVKKEDRFIAIWSTGRHKLPILRAGTSDDRTKSHVLNSAHQALGLGLVRGRKSLPDIEWL